MQERKLSEVPEYLRDGELYKLMLENSEDPNEMLTFDASVMKDNTSVKCSYDCDYLLNSLRFWGVNTFHEEIAAFVLNHPSAENDAILAKYEQQFPYARALCMIKKTYDENMRVKGQLCDAIEAGCVEVVEYLLSGKNVLPPIGACMLASRAGNSIMLAYVHQRGYMLSNALLTAVVGGHLDCLQYAHRSGVPYPLSDGLLFETAQRGHLACMQYLHRNGCRWDPVVCNYAALNGHLNCLQYAHENGCPWQADTCISAASAGHLHCLQYAHQNDCPWNADTCHTAIKNGQLACLQYAMEQGCTINADACMHAASVGHLSCLMYLHEKGCPWNEHTCKAAANNGHIECLKYAHMNGSNLHAKLLPKRVTSSA